MGRPADEKPPGMEMPGRPARFVLTVYRSKRYMARGSSTFSPSLKAGVGVTGPAMRSTSSKALSKSWRIRRRTLRAFL